tara:strand:+ start:527 stop:925 length:399 start_codon:yes stop_codon:yes gene_type:complete
MLKNTFKLNGVGLLILMLIVLAIGQIGLGLKIKESFSNINDDEDKVNNDWLNRATFYQSQMGYAEYVKSLETTTSPVEGLNSHDMTFLANNKFTPECCPSMYSSSTGCACITPEQGRFLNERGNNRKSCDGV